MIKKFTELEARMSPEARQRVSRRVEYELKKMEYAEKESTYRQSMPDICEMERKRIVVNV